MSDDRVRAWVCTSRVSMGSRRGACAGTSTVRGTKTWSAGEPTAPQPESNTGAVERIGRDAEEHVHRVRLLSSDPGGNQHPYRESRRHEQVVPAVRQVRQWHVRTIGRGVIARKEQRRTKLPAWIADWAPKFGVRWTEVQPSQYNSWASCGRMSVMRFNRRIIQTPSLSWTTLWRTDCPSCLLA